jgi:hypothetical protein
VPRIDITPGRVMFEAELKVRSYVMNVGRAAPASAG